MNAPALTQAQIIVLATPVFFALMALELVVGARRGRTGWRVADAISSITLGMLSQLVGLFAKLFLIGIYIAAHEHLALVKLPTQSIWVWLGALVAYDFCYYWHHRAGHRIGALWAAHVVHHQSEDFNLSTALRQPLTGAPMAWVFYLPLAIAGVPPVVFATVALIDLLYQYWVHTEQIGRLGWFDRWFVSPSNHRVHHAVNERYLDKNYGGILIVWDRLFGTFEDEDAREPCVYGTRAPLRRWEPLAATLQVWRDLALDAWRAQRWRDKPLVFLKPPGWRPADVVRRWPRPPFDIHGHRRWEPELSPRRARLAVFGFGLLLAGTALVLWNAHRLDTLARLGAVVALFAAAWILGRGLEGPRRPGVHEGIVAAR
jgi:sterol desaturase/sphingolipid hydroxylase (fatty acid hydroxylase superfamily)